MKNLFCALSILTVCTASNLSHIDLFDSLTILSNRSAELKFKTEETNNESKNKTLDTFLKTIVSVKNLQQIVKMLYENQLDMFNFTYPGVFFQQGDNESEELNTKHLKTEDSLPRNKEKISIARSKRNLNDLEKNDRLQNPSVTLAFLVRHIKDVIKSALSEVLLELSKSSIDRSQSQLQIIDEIASVLSQTLEILTYGHGQQAINLSSGITDPEDEVESKLEELCLVAKSIYEEIYYSQFFRNSENMEDLETSNSTFDRMDEWINFLSDHSSATSKPLLEKENVGEEEDLTKRRSMSGNEGLYQNREHKVILDEKIPTKEPEVSQENVEKFDEDSRKLKHPFLEVHDNSAVSTRPLKNATDMDINATNAGGIPKDLKGSSAEVHDLPKLVQKKFDVRGTQDKKTITHTLKKKNANFTKNNVLPGFPKKKMRALPEMPKRKEEGSIKNAYGDKTAPSQRGLFENLDIKSGDTEIKNSEELTEKKSKTVMDAILEAIDEVISPLNGKNETLRYKKPVLTKDKFFEEVLKDESV